MVDRFSVLKLTLIGVLIFAEPTLACRTMRSLPINIVTNADYRKDFQSGDDLPSTPPALPAPTGYGSPPYIGNRIVVTITIVNMGNIPQQGVVRFYLGDTQTDRCTHRTSQHSSSGDLTAYASQRDDAGTLYWFTPAICLCAASDAQCIPSGSLTPGAGAASTLIPYTNVPTDRVWKISQLSGQGQSPITTVRAIFLFSGYFSNPPNAATGVHKAYANFVPTFEIVVDEDKGAVLASMVYNITQANESPSTVNVCGILPMPKSYMGYFPPPVPLPIPINGGRPF